MTVRRFLLAVFVLIPNLCAGCAAGSYAAEADYGAMEMARQAPMALPEDSGGDTRTFDFDEALVDGELIVEEDGASEGSASPEKSPPDVETQQARMIIYTAQLGLLVFKVEEKLDEAAAMGKEHGGWIQQSTSSSLTIRVPAEKFEALLEGLQDLGDVSHKNVVGNDVTEEFFDLQIRMKNAMVLRDRFIALLAQAKSVEASIAIEKELARLTEQIERMKGRSRFLRDQSAYSTITIDFQPKQASVRPGRIPLPFDWLRDYSIEGVLR